MWRWLLEQRRPIPTPAPAPGDPQDNKKKADKK
jgi:hypothetical protein